MERGVLHSAIKATHRAIAQLQLVKCQTPQETGPQHLVAELMPLVTILLLWEELPILEASIPPQ